MMALAFLSLLSAHAQVLNRSETVPNRSELPEIAVDFVREAIELETSQRDDAETRFLSRLETSTPIDQLRMWRTYTFQSAFSSNPDDFERGQTEIGRLTTMTS